MRNIKVKNANIKPRQWQIDCHNKALKWFVEIKTHKQFIINAAPASGKTVAACLIAKNLFECGKIDRIIIIAPQAGVTHQWAKEIKNMLGLHMEKVNSSDDLKMSSLTDHICATWQALNNIQDAVQAICNKQKVLVICDEHHHAALEASWGASADSAFQKAKYCLILTGTPIRTDGKQCTWLSLGKNNQFIFPKEGMYELNYGKAVDLGYCVPATFHRFEGLFTVDLGNGSKVPVSSKIKPKLSKSLKKDPVVQNSIDFFKLTKLKKYEKDGSTPSKNSYLGLMIEFGINKLIQKKNELPEAGGLIIAPDILTAEYMAKLVELISGKKAIIVHSNMKNSQKKINTFRRNVSIDWLVSVAMVSEGVDIPRLRSVIYIPNALTELAFRQALGRVVRKCGNEDYSSASFIMPPLSVFENYAKRIEIEMGISKGVNSKILKKVCPKCSHKNDFSNKNCNSCNYKFAMSNQVNFKTCQICSTLNPITSKVCQNCGQSFQTSINVSLKEALRDGAIIRGNQYLENDVLIGELHGSELKKIFSQNPVISKMLSLLPEEGYADFFKECGRINKKINPKIMRR
jgi:superfamily II DNA or RNA helicase